jgi:hypothetical protein
MASVITVPGVVARCGRALCPEAQVACPAYRPLDVSGPDGGKAFRGCASNGKSTECRVTVKGKTRGYETDADVEAHPSVPHVLFGFM